MMQPAAAKHGESLWQCTVRLEAYAVRITVVGKDAALSCLRQLEGIVLVIPSERSLCRLLSWSEEEGSLAEVLSLYPAAVAQGAFYIYELPCVILYLKCYPALNALHALPSFGKETDEQARMLLLHMLARTLGYVSLTIVACFLWLIIYRYDARVESCKVTEIVSTHRLVEEFSLVDERIVLMLYVEIQLPLGVSSYLVIARVKAVLQRKLSAGGSLVGDYHVLPLHYETVRRE